MQTMHTIDIWHTVNEEVNSTKSQLKIDTKKKERKKYRNKAHRDRKKME